MHKKGRTEKIRNESPLLGPQYYSQKDCITAPRKTCLSLKKNTHATLLNEVFEKKKQKQHGILSNSKNEYCMHDEHHFLHIYVEALTEATIELSDSIPILLLVVPSPPSCCQLPLLKYLIHLWSLAMSLRMRSRRVTISVTSLMLK